MSPKTRWLFAVPLAFLALVLGLILGASCLRTLAADEMYERGVRALETGDPGRAIPHLNKAIQLNPEHFWAIRGRGEAYCLLREYDQALADCNEAIRLAPRAGPYLVRARCYQEIEEFRLALRDCDEAIRLDPNNASAYLVRGEIHAKQSDHARAIADFTATIKFGQQPAERLAYRARAEAYRAVGDEASAAQDDR